MLGGRRQMYAENLITLPYTGSNRATRTRQGYLCLGVGRDRHLQVVLLYSS